MHIFFIFTPSLLGYNYSLQFCVHNFLGVGQLDWDELPPIECVCVCVCIFATLPASHIIYTQLSAFSLVK